MRRLLALLSVLILLAGSGPAWADGPQFNGTCTAIEWTQNTEPDLAWYRIYDRVSLTAEPTMIKEVGTQVTSLPCSTFAFNPGQHYISITAGDTSGNESEPSTEFAFVLVVTNQVSDFHVTVVNTTDMTVSWIEVDDGTGQPAKYDIRMATPTIDWGTASTVSAGTCAGVVTGTTIGAPKTCTVTGLTNGVAYQFQAVPYRGTLGVDAVFGPLSVIAGATAGGSPEGAVERPILATDLFTRADNADLGASWDGGYTDRNVLKISGNAVRATVAGQESHETYNAAALPADQWAQLTLSAIAGTGWNSAGLVLRSAAPATRTYYLFAITDQSGTDSTTLYRCISGACSPIGSATVSWAAADVVQAEAQADQLRLYRNDQLVLTVTDAQIASGRAGLAVYAGSDTSAVVIGDWSAGGFTSQANQPSSLATDSFNRADENPLSNGGVWSTTYTGTDAPQVVGNRVRPTTAGGNSNVASLNSPTFPNNQYAKMVIATAGGASAKYYSTLVRMSAPTTFNGYRCTAYINTDTGYTSSIAKITAGTSADLVTENATTWAVTDTVDCRAEGTTLSLFRNGVVLLTTSDSTYSTGRPGIRLYSQSGVANVEADDFDAGEFVAESADADPCGCDSH